MSIEAIFPKRYLGWDTSSVTGVVVAFELLPSGSLRIVAEWALSLETSRHSERLLWTLDTVLQSAGWTLKDLHGLVVGVGPGSFTGLRIGITTARMLAAQLQIPVVSISSLALLARGALPFLEPVAGPILLVACTDATKGEWFTLVGTSQAVSECVMHGEDGAKGLWNESVTERAMACELLLDQVNEELENNPELRWLAIGQSVERYSEDFKRLPAERRLLLSSPEIHRVRATSLAFMAKEAIQKGLMIDFSSVKPRYLRASEAEVKLQKGLLKASPTESPI